MLFIKNKIISIFLIILVVFTILYIFDIPSKIRKMIYKKEYSEYVEKYSKEYEVDENLVYAVIKAESNFKQNANSSKNAIGLMQLMKSTALEICSSLNVEVSEEKIIEKLKEPDFNIKLGTKYLSILISRYKNIGVAITAYNAGIGTVDNWIENKIIKSDGSDLEKIPYKETNNYVRKILRDYKIYSNI